MSEFPILPLLGVFLLVALFLITCGWCFKKSLERLYTIEIDPARDLAAIGLKFTEDTWPVTEEDYEDIDTVLEGLKRP